jgi:hypothetical protein
MTRPTLGRSPRRWSGAPNSSVSTWSPSSRRPPASNPMSGSTGPRSGASCSSSASSGPTPTAGSEVAISPVAGSEPRTPLTARSPDVPLAHSGVGAASAERRPACRQMSR